MGKEASEWRELLAFHPTPGFCDEHITMFVATGLTDVHGGATPEDDEHIEIVAWPLADLDGAIQATSDGKTLIGLEAARRLG